MQNSCFLVDSSVWIFALRKQFIPAIKERVDSLLKECEIMTNGMIKLELLGGTKSKQEFQRLKNRLDALDTIDINTRLWEEAYSLSFKLRRKGLTVPYTDILTAACAINAKAILVHADAHFDLMAEHTDLKVESCLHLVKQGLR